MCFFYQTVMCAKDADGLANSVDLDQTAPSNLIWIYTVCPDLSVKIFSIITVFSFTFKGSVLFLCNFRRGKKTRG